MTGKTLKVPVRSGKILTLELWNDEADAVVSFGPSYDAPGAICSDDTWRAEVQWPQSASLPPYWKLRYWVGNAVQGRLAPTRYGTPGDVVAARVGGGRGTIDAVNAAVYSVWPKLDWRAGA